MGFPYLYCPASVLLLSPQPDPYIPIILFPNKSTNMPATDLNYSQLLDREAKGIPIGRVPEVNLRNTHAQYIFTWYVLRCRGSSLQTLHPLRLGSY